MLVRPELTASRGPALVDAWPTAATSPPWAARRELRAATGVPGPSAARSSQRHVASVNWGLGCRGSAEALAYERSPTGCRRTPLAPSSCGRALRQTGGEAPPLPLRRSEQRRYRVAAHPAFLRFLVIHGTPFRVCVLEFLESLDSLDQPAVERQEGVLRIGPSFAMATRTRTSRSRSESATGLRCGPWRDPPAAEPRSAVEQLDDLDVQLVDLRPKRSRSSPSAVSRGGTNRSIRSKSSVRQSLPLASVLPAAFEAGTRTMGDELECRGIPRLPGPLSLGRDVVQEVDVANVSRLDGSDRLNLDER